MVTFFSFEEGAVSKKIVFDLYRYQIIPISKQFQMRLDRTIDYKEIIKKRIYYLSKRSLMLYLYIEERKYKRVCRLYLVNNFILYLEKS